MSDEEKGVSRRQFMELAALATAGVVLEPSLVCAAEEQKKGGKAKLSAPPAPSPQPAGPASSKVILVRDRAAVDPSGVRNAAVLARMLDDAVCALAATDKPAQAWGHFFGPGDVAGIKTNVWNFLATPREVEEVLKKRIAACGIPQESIRITDRAARKDLATCTALLNVRPVRTHHWAGVGGCIKNYIMFVEDPSAYHPDSCADLGAIWNLPAVKGKTRLNVLLALTPQFYGRGPHSFDPRYVWPYGGMFVSRDPVAVDAMGAELLRLKRTEFFGEDRPVTSWKHIELADTRHGIGVADPKHIDLVKIGWQEKMLLA